MPIRGQIIETLFKNGSKRKLFDTLNILTDLKGPKNIICTMDDVRGDVLGPLNGTTPASVIANKILKFDPLEAVKTLKGYGPHCAIPSSYKFLKFVNQITIKF